MTRKTKVRIALVAGAILLGCPCAFFGSWGAAIAGSDSGSPELAAEWREKLTPIDSLETAKARALTEQFPNGEWVAWLSADSHGIWIRGGGTVVIKDSRGQIRAFFGHVCGSFSPPFGSNSLDDFYTRMASQTRYREHHFD